MGRKSKIWDTYIYIQLIHFAVKQKLTQHCKATILLQIILKREKNIEITLGIFSDQNLLRLEINYKRKTIKKKKKNTVHEG